MDCRLLECLERPRPVLDPETGAPVAGPDGQPLMEYDYRGISVLNTALMKQFAREAALTGADSPKKLEIDTSAEAKEELLKEKAAGADLAFGKIWEPLRANP